MSARIWLRRAYEKPTRNDGYRVLVDRLWPRGITRADLQIDEWCRDIAPSNELRQWFSHDPQRWAGFRQRYRDELERVPKQVEHLAALVEQGRVTLLFAAHDQNHNNAVVLRELLEEHHAHMQRGDQDAR